MVSRQPELVLAVPTLLTFHFTSDYYTTSSGWEALVDCVGSYEPMIIDVTANPEVINEGESSQLTATVTGGAGNYTFRLKPPTKSL